MFPCPHCGRDVEGKSPPKDVPWYMDVFGCTRQTTSLGCGTLILIAIIVAVFSTVGDDDGVRGLRGDIRDLEVQVKELRGVERELRALRQAIERQRAEPPKAAEPDGP